MPVFEMVYTCNQTVVGFNQGSSVYTLEWKSWTLHFQLSIPLGLMRYGFFMKPTQQ